MNCMRQLLLFLVNSQPPCEGTELTLIHYAPTTPQDYDSSVSNSWANKRHICGEQWYYVESGVEEFNLLNAAKQKIQTLKTTPLKLIKFKYHENTSGADITLECVDGLDSNIDDCADSFSSRTYTVQRQVFIAIMQYYFLTDSTGQEVFNTTRLDQIMHFLNCFIVLGVTKHAAESYNNLPNMNNIQWFEGTVYEWLSCIDRDRDIVNRKGLTYKVLECPASEMGAVGYKCDKINGTPNTYADAEVACYDDDVAQENSRKFAILDLKCERRCSTDLLNTICNKDHASGTGRVSTNKSYYPPLGATMTDPIGGATTIDNWITGEECNSDDSHGDKWILKVPLPLFFFVQTSAPQVTQVEE